MRNSTTGTAFGWFAGLMLMVDTLAAAPITGGTGPGGIGALGVVNAGPTLWLNADDLTGSQTPTTKVTTWTDSSTFGNHAIADAGSLNTFQTNVRNGNAVVRLPGAVNAREFTVAGLSGRTFVAALTVNGTFACCDGLFGEIGGDGGLRTFNNGSAAWQTTGPIGGGGIDVNGTGAASFGAFNNWHNVQAFSTGGLISHTNLGIGQYFSTGDRELQGDIGEVAVYAQLLNTAQRQILNSYYGAKYNFAVTNDRYTGDNGGNGDYNRNVFGVGRVDAGNIYNDADALGPGSGTGAAGFGIAAVNATLGDGEFVMAGHRVAVNSIVDFEGGPSFLGNRWNRAWYVDTNGGQIDAALSFDFSDGGVSGDFNINDSWQLLFSSDQDFSDGWEIVTDAFVRTGDTITFNLTSADLINGYYTLGINVGQIPEPSTFALLALGCSALLPRRRRSLLVCTTS